MTTTETVYLGKLRCNNTHKNSGTELMTDAPIDNQGIGILLLSHRPMCIDPYNLYYNNSGNL